MQKELGHWEIRVVSLQNFENLDAVIRVFLLELLILCLLHLLVWVDLETFGFQNALTTGDRDWEIFHHFIVLFEWPVKAFYDSILDFQIYQGVVVGIFVVRTIGTCVEWAQDAFIVIGRKLPLLFSILPQEVDPVFWRISDRNKVPTIRFQSRILSVHDALEFQVVKLGATLVLFL